MIEFLKQPWPWYIAGPLIGLTVPALLLMGNKPFGISSSLRHICAAVLPQRLPYFKYNWRNEVWNLFFVAGIVIGGLIAAQFLANGAPMQLNENLKTELAQYGINDYKTLVPVEIFNFESLITVRGFVLLVIGGFLVGFGTRYANGCTSGHSIMGISNLQWPSMVATCCFMAGGFLVSNFILPIILKL